MDMINLVEISNLQDLFNPTKKLYPEHLFRGDNFLVGW